MTSLRHRLLQSRAAGAVLRITYPRASWQLRCDARLRGRPGGRARGHHHHRERPGHPAREHLIINRADRYGLAQLYQLRGRVGRSERRASAFLMVPPDTVLSEIARKRLAAMREFSELGAGFRVAALDLELRGAGNLLGGEQSGHIQAVGPGDVREAPGADDPGAAGPGPAPRADARSSNLQVDMRLPRSTCPRSTSGCRSTSASARRDEGEVRRWRRGPRPLRRAPPAVEACCGWADCACGAEPLGVARWTSGRRAGLRFAPGRRSDGATLPAVPRPGRGPRSPRRGAAPPLPAGAAPRRRRSGTCSRPWRASWRGRAGTAV